MRPKDESDESWIVAGQEWNENDRDSIENAKNSYPSLENEMKTRWYKAKKRKEKKDEDEERCGRKENQTLLIWKWFQVDCSDCE